MKQSDTLGGLILIPLTLSVLFCHLLSKICRAGRKKKCVCFVLFLFFCFPASVPCSTLFPGLVLLCFFICFYLFIFYSFFFPGVVCFISHAIWLVSESNFVLVLPCFPPTPLFTDRRTHIHIFPQTDTLPSHSKQINSSLAALGTPQRNAEAHRSPANVTVVINEG